MKLADFMKVDIDNLWQACENHLPALEYFTRDLPDLKYRYAKLKIQLDKLIAELDKKIREEAAENGIKITEKSIEQTIARNDDVVALREQIVEIKKEIDKLERIKTLFEHRRDMIKTLSSILAISGAEAINEKMIGSIKDKLGDYWGTADD